MASADDPNYYDESDDGRVDAETPEEVITKLKNNDPRLKVIVLFDNFPTKQISEMVDCLLEYPNDVRHIELPGTNCSDSAGVKLAKYVASSSVITFLCLMGTFVKERTILALATALRTNTSLRHLSLSRVTSVDYDRVNMEFVTTLRLNPSRPERMFLKLDNNWHKYKEFKKIADELGHPTLQMLLLGCHITNDRFPRTCSRRRR